MSPGTVQLLSTLGAALVGFVGIWLATRQNGRTAKYTDAQAMMDQIQEERDKSEERSAAALSLVEVQHSNALAAMGTRLTEGLQRIDRLESRDRLLLDYVSQLRWHIDSGNPPPPPPWPSGLGWDPHRDT